METLNLSPKALSTPPPDRDSMHNLPAPGRDGNDVDRGPGELSYHVLDGHHQRRAEDVLVLDSDGNGIAVRQRPAEKAAEWLRVEPSRALLPVDAGGDQDTGCAGDG